MEIYATNLANKPIPRTLKYNNECGISETAGSGWCTVLVTWR
jgi:hypothetical protein